MKLDADFLTDIDNMLFWSFRYGIGRATYVVSDIADTIIKHKSALSENHRKMIIREINEAIEHRCAGMSCDVAQWEKVKRVLEE